MKVPPVSAHEGYPQGCVGVRNVRGVIVKVITRPLTKEESRKIFPYRPFNEHAESRFGGDDLADDEVLIKNRIAVPCKMCGAATRKGYIILETCPDCDGGSEVNGKDPHMARECCGNCHDG